jgi:hypothetical protein
MTKMGRKRFFGVAGGSILTGVGVLYPGAAEAGRTMRAGAATANPNATVVSITGPDPNYAGGEVVARSADGIVLKTSNGMRAVRVPVGTVVWREVEGDLGLIELHDWVDVKGAPQDDGSLLARSGMVFANIGRADGILSEVTPSAVLLADSRGPAKLDLSPRLEVLRSVDGSHYANGVQGLTVGEPVGAVGLMLSDGGLRATRIWSY